MRKFKGDLEGFPSEVVEKMLERQVGQGNVMDVNVFEVNLLADEVDKGFTWSLTEEGYLFWEKVLIERDFDHFFERYPKKPEISEESKPDEITKAKLIYAEGKEVIFDLDNTYIENGMLIIKAK